MDGWIYILSNKAFADGLIKIGCSSKDPIGRKKELETTGVPDDFHIEYRALIASFSSLERKIHQSLAEYRPRKDKEFFTCSITVAINTIREIVGHEKIKYEDIQYKSFERLKLPPKTKNNQEEIKAPTIASESKEKKADSGIFSDTRYILHNK